MSVDFNQTQKLPAGWRQVQRSEDHGNGSFTDGKVVAVMLIHEDAKGNHALHVAVARNNGTRPNRQDMKKVKRDLMNPNNGRIVENNRRLKTSDQIRNLWQILEVEEEESSATLVKP